MGSRRGKEGLLLAVFWVVAIALIGTAANRLILHGPLGRTLQKKETGRMLMELSVLFLWNLWWLCLAVKSREKRGLAIACLIPGWLLFLWGHRILIPLIGAGVWMGTLAGYGIFVGAVCNLQTNELRDTGIPQGTLSCPSGNSPCVAPA